MNESQPSLFNGESSPSTQKNEYALLALAGVKGVGFITVRFLYRHFEGDLTKAFSSSPAELKDILGAAHTPGPIGEIADRIWNERASLVSDAKAQHRFLAERRNIHITFLGDERYPTRLSNAPSPPAWLFVEGDPAVLNAPGLAAVVGTRNPSPFGVGAARRLSTLLARDGVVITSGLAEGIDAVAHQSAVDLDTPTIAVLGHGIDVTYPVSTTALRQRISKQGGAVISEYLPSDTFGKEKFVQRNRIQAALSDVVGVVEARSKSGTAHTVRFAEALNRPLFGVTLDGPDNLPQHEILSDLLKHNHPVFDLANGGVNKLKAFLLEHVHSRSVDPAKTAGHLFGGCLRETERIIHEYQATEQEVSWYIDEVKRLAKRSQIDAD